MKKNVASDHWSLVTGHWSLSVHWSLKVLLVCLGIIGLTLIWALPRGLDLTDESFYILHIYYPRRYPTLYGFGVIYHQIFNGFAFDVLDLRRAKLVQALIEATVFGVAFVHFFCKNKNQKSRLIAFLTLLCVNFVGFSLFLPTISYNDLNNFCTALSVAGLLFCLSSPSPGTNAPHQSPGIGRYVWLLGSGFFAGFNFFNKGSASLALALLVYLVLIYFHRSEWRKTVRLVLVWTLGYGLALVSFFAFIQPFNGWYASFSEALQGKEHQFGLLSLLGWYGYFLARVGLFLFVILAPWILLFSLWFERRRQRLSPAYRSALSYAAFVWSGGFILGSKLIWGGKEAFGKLSLVYLLLILALLLVLDVRLRQRQIRWNVLWRQKNMICVWALFFFLVPFACCVGSGNSLTRQAAFHMLFWGASLLLLQQLLRAYGQPGYAVSVGIGLLVTFQVITGTADPYAASAINANLSTPGLYEQTTYPTTGLPGLNRIRFDPQSLAAYQQLRQVVGKYRSQTNNQAIFYDLPGLNFITQTVSPGTEWYFHDLDGFLCYSLSQTTFTPPNLPLVAYLDGRRLSAVAQRCFRSRQLLVPGTYRRIVSIYLPSQGDTLHVFLPNGARLPGPG